MERDKGSIFPLVVTKFGTAVTPGTSEVYNEGEAARVKYITRDGKKRDVLLSTFTKTATFYMDKATNDEYWLHKAHPGPQGPRDQDDSITPASPVRTPNVF